MFEIGREYHRSTEVHGRFQGQRQGGISTPKDHPVVFVFTSTAGEQHGYVDEFRANGQFWYTGEGQSGDMTMTGGNKAIRDHAINNKTIHLFEYTRRAYVKYLGEAIYLGHHEERRPDTSGNLRTVFVFHLYLKTADSRVQERGIEAVNLDVKQLKAMTLDQLREAALTASHKEVSGTRTAGEVYYRSEAIKQYVLRRAAGVCEGCRSEAPFLASWGPFIECHHIHRLSDGGPDHPQNVAGLCPNCHKRAHYSKDRKAFNEALIVAVKGKESEH